MVAQKWVDKFICCFGAPERIRTDQLKNFDFSLFAKVCHILGIQKTRTLEYHAEGDTMNSLIEFWKQCFPNVGKNTRGITMSTFPKSSWPTDPVFKNEPDFHCTSGHNVGKSSRSTSRYV